MVPVPVGFDPVAVVDRQGVALDAVAIPVDSFDPETAAHPRDRQHRRAANVVASGAETILVVPVPTAFEFVHE